MGVLRMTRPDTNTVTPAQDFTKESLEVAMEKLRNIKPPEFDHFKAGVEYWQHLKALRPLPNPPQGMIGGYMGFNIFVDETLPPGVMEARDKNGKVLATFRLGEE